MWSKLKRLLCYESQHQSQSNEKSLVQFDYEKAVSNYLGTQSTFSFTVAFKIYCFTSSRVCTHQSSFPPARLHCPHCCNTIARLLGSVRTFPTPLLEYYCTTFGKYTTFPHPPFVCHTPYDIINDNLVFRPSSASPAPVQG